MSKSADPFERAVAREEKLRQRAAKFDSRAGLMRLVVAWFAAMIVGWLVVLAAHWIFLSDPRWLAVLHSIVFILVAGYWASAALFVTVFRRRRPDLFGDVL